MYLIRFFTLVLISLFAVPAHAAPSIPEMFKHFFETKYVPICGKNVFDFVKLLDAQSKGFRVLSIENRGNTVAGQVNVERARGERFRKPAVVEMNYGHHVFLLDPNGKVYDFDYTVTPTILPFPEYAEKMFLEEPECTKPVYGEFCVGRAHKLKDYIIESTEAEAVLTETNPPPIRVTLGEALENWKKLLP